GRFSSASWLVNQRGDVISVHVFGAIETSRKTRRVRVGKIQRTAGTHRHDADDSPSLKILCRLDVIRVADRAGQGQNELPGGRDVELHSAKDWHGVGHFA